MCSSPEDVNDIYKNTSTISYHNTIKDMYRWMHVTPAGFDRMFALDPSAAHNAELPRPVEAAYMINEYHRRQTKPGAHFDSLFHGGLLPHIDATLDGAQAGASPAVRQKGGDGVTVSLFGLCVEFFLRGTITGYVGQKMWDVSPGLLDTFHEWERTNWKWMFQMPGLMSGDMNRSLNGLIDSFVAYLAIPAAERADANHFVQNVEAMMRDVGMSDKDMARILTLHFWA